MKKNLRIVSAAAALLAVAPVAATNITLGNHHYEKTPNVEVSSHLVAYTTPRQIVINNQTGVATEHLWNGRVNGTISASLDGQSYTANLNSNVTIYTLKKGANGNTISDYTEVKADKSGAYRLEPGVKYFVRVNNISFNFGSANANRKDILISGADGVHFVMANTAKTISEVTPGDSVDVNGLKTVKAYTNSNKPKPGYQYDNKGITLEGTNAKVIASGFNFKADGKTPSGNVVVEYTGKSGKIKHYAVVDVDDLIANTNAALVKEANGSSTVTAKGDTIKASTDQNGALNDTLEAFVQVIPSDVTNSESVNFFAKDTNTEVTTGALNLAANPSSHQLNVSTVLKKGSSVTTYGKSFMIAGHQMYRIGENKYVKKANF